MIDFKIGIPYSFKSYNCWDYVADIRAENGIKTKHYQPVNLGNAFEIITAEMQRLGHGLTRVNKPDNFDVIIVHKNTNKRPIYHCGLYFDGMAIHCDRNAKQVVSESYNEFISKYDGVNLWR